MNDSNVYSNIMEINSNSYNRSGGVAFNFYENSQESSDIILSKYSEYVPAAIATIGLGIDFVYLNSSSKVYTSRIIVNCISQLQTPYERFKCIKINEGYSLIVLFGTLVLVKEINGIVKYRILFSLGVREENFEKYSNYAGYIRSYHGRFIVPAVGLEMWHHEDKFYIEDTFVAKKVKDIWNQYTEILSKFPIMYSIKTDNQMNKMIFQKPKLSFDTKEQFDEYNNSVIKSVIEYG